MRFHIGCLWFHHRTEWPPKDHSHVAASRRPVFVLDGNASWDFLSWLAKDDEPFYSFILQLLERPNKHGTRWAPTSYKWGYHSTYIGDMSYKPSYPLKIYKAIYRGPITPFITGKGTPYKGAVHGSETLSPLNKERTWIARPVCR